MATPTPVEKMDRRELATELLALHRKHHETFARIDDLKGALRKAATEAGANFKEEFAGKGVVKVAGAKDGAFKGILPEIVPETFLELPEAKRKKLIDDGLVKMTPQYGGKFYGSVTVELF